MQAVHVASGGFNPACVFRSSFLRVTPVKNRTNEKARRIASGFSISIMQAA
jgi:hypothetical protein